MMILQVHRIRTSRHIKSRTKTRVWVVVQAIVSRHHIDRYQNIVQAGRERCFSSNEFIQNRIYFSESDESDEGY